MSLADMEIEYVSQRVCFWLQSATGTKGWEDPCSYTDPSGILPGEMGTYKGVRVVELGWDPEHPDPSQMMPATQGWDEP